MNVQNAQKIYFNMRQNKMNYRPHWEELSDYIAPTKGRFVQRNLNLRKEINYKKKQVIIKHMIKLLNGLIKKKIEKI